MEARYMTDLEWRICHAVNIYLYRNGRDGEAPILVHIPPAKKKNMKTVLNVIQERVKYPVGYAAYLYKMDGKKVRHPCELEMYNNYVIASNYDKYFKCAQYGRKRSPLLVLNRDSKHIRVLRQQNQNYSEWMLKKNAIGEERAQYIYPTFYTNENARAQDLPVGHMGNFMPPGLNNTNNTNPTTPQKPPTSGVTSKKEFAVKTCIIENDPIADQTLKNQQERLLKNAYGDTKNGTNWEKKEKAQKHKRKGMQLRESDIINANLTMDEDIVPSMEDQSSEIDFPGTITDSESALETDCMGSKYQYILRRFKRKLKKRALQEIELSSSELSLHLPRERFHPKMYSISGMSGMSSQHDEQIHVLPPPPLEFRDDIIPRGGTYFFYN